MSKRTDSMSGEDIFLAVKEYLGDKEPEVEYKIEVDRKTFIDMLHVFTRLKPVLTQTTNALYPIDVPNIRIPGFRYNYIMSKDYQKSTDAISTYTKQRLVDANLSDFPNIKLSISLEIPVKDKPKGIGQVTLYRIKNRLSFECGEWRYDFTQVLHIDPTQAGFTPNSVRVMATRLFADCSPLSGDALVNKFVATSSDPSIEKLELEVELIDKFTVKHVNSHSFLDCLNHEKRLVLKNTIYLDLMLKSIAVALGKNPNGRLSIKRLLPAATTLSKVEYNYIYPPVDYYISRKADGERALLVTTRDEVTYLITDKLQQLDHFEHSHQSGVFVPMTILEGEFIGGKTNHFLIYDVLMENGKLVTGKMYPDRIALAGQCSDYYKELKVVKVLPKKVYRITENLYDVFKQVSTEHFDYPDDGYIMTEYHNDYFNTRCYKIKEHNTIDFVVAKMPTKFMAQLPIDAKKAKTSTVYLLFCGINVQTMENMGISKLTFYDEMFRGCKFHGRIPIHFAPPDNPYAFIWYANNSEDKILSEYLAKADPTRPWVIAELDYKDGWHLMRVREDRFNEPNYYGNDYVVTALPTWIIIQDPLRIQDMHLSVINYFKTGKDDYYKSQTTAMSFIKYTLFDILFKEIANKKPSVIDLAVGKGQDLNKYVSHGVSRLLGIDIDRVALNELLTRYYALASKYDSKVKMNVSIMQQDLSQPQAEIVDRIKSLWKVGNDFVYPDLIVCNLAIHYFIKTVDELSNVTSMIKSLLPSGGLFMYTTFNGKAIHQLLLDSPNGEWISQVSGSVKYRIIKKYPGEQLHEFGQTIQVKLPFTGDDLYEENLVNIDLVNETFESMGMQVLKTGSYSDFFPLLRTKHKAVEEDLSDDDKLFIGLYHYTILKMT